MTNCTGSEHVGRMYSDHLNVWYDLYRCEQHGFHVNADHDQEW